MDGIQDLEMVKMKDEQALKIVFGALISIIAILLFCLFAICIDAIFDLGLSNCI